MAQDTWPISSSAPCHGAKKVRMSQSECVQSFLLLGSWCSRKYIMKYRYAYFFFRTCHVLNKAVPVGFYEGLQL